MVGLEPEVSIARGNSLMKSTYIVVAKNYEIPEGSRKRVDVNDN